MSDLLTNLQRELKDTQEKFGELVEELLQHAPPSIVDPEPLPGRRSTDPPLQEELVVASGDRGSWPTDKIQTEAAKYAAELVSKFKAMNSLIDKLPDCKETASEQNARISSLLQQQHDARAQLVLETEMAEVKLEQIQGLYAVLAEATLANRLKAAMPQA